MTGNGWCRPPLLSLVILILIIIEFAAEKTRDFSRLPEGIRKCVVLKPPPHYSHFLFCRGASRENSSPAISIMPGKKTDGASSSASPNAPAPFGKGTEKPPTPIQDPIARWLSPETGGARPLGLDEVVSGETEPLEEGSRKGDSGELMLSSGAVSKPRKTTAEERPSEFVEVIRRTRERSSPGHRVTTGASSFRGTYVPAPSVQGTEKPPAPIQDPIARGLSPETGGGHTTGS